MIPVGLLGGKKPRGLLVHQEGRTNGGAERKGGVQKNKMGFWYTKKSPVFGTEEERITGGAEGGGGSAERRNFRYAEKVGIQALISVVKYLMTQFCVMHVSLRIGAHAAFSLAVLSFPLPVHFLVSRLGKFFWIEFP